MHRQKRCVSKYDNMPRKIVIWLWAIEWNDNLSTHVPVMMISGNRVFLIYGHIENLIVRCASSGDEEKLRV